MPIFSPTTITGALRWPLKSSNAWFGSTSAAVETPFARQRRDTTRHDMEGDHAVMLNPIDKDELSHSRGTARIILAS